MAGVYVRVRGWVRDRGGVRGRVRVRSYVRFRGGVRVGLGVRLQLCIREKNKCTTAVTGAPLWPVLAARLYTPLCWLVGQLVGRSPFYFVGVFEHF